MRSKISRALVAFACLIVSRPAQGGDGVDPDLDCLRAARIVTDGPGLLRFLAEQGTKSDRLGELPELIRKLGHRSFAQREDAARVIVGFGPAATGALRRASDDSDKEVARRARDCLQEIERTSNPQVMGAAVRRVLRLKPAGLVPTLVRFLPLIPDEVLEEQAWYALDAWTVKAGKVDAAVVAALRDPIVSRRALAAYLAGRRGNATLRKETKRLLDDKSAMVRLRAAQGLLGGGDKGAVPVLIDLLDDEAAEVRWQAEELLRWAAGDAAPSATVGAGGREDREKCRAAWRAWWNANGPKFDLAARMRDYRRPVLVLLCDRGTSGATDGRVWLAGSDGTTRSEWTGLLNPTDARLLAGGRVLIAECEPEKPALRGEPGVSERDLDGTVRWRFRGMQRPVSCRRLPGGSTFVADTSGQIAEVDGAGKAVSTSRPRAPRAAPFAYNQPQWLSSGRLLCRVDWPRFDSVVDFVELDPVSGQKLRQVHPFGEVVLPETAKLEGLVDGSYLVAGVGGKTKYYVLEINQEGNVAWRCPVPGCSHAVRLPDGTTLIGGAGRLIEVSRDRRLVGEAFFDTDLQRLHACLGLVRLGFDRPADAGTTLVTPPPLTGLRSPDRRIQRRTIAYLANHGVYVPGAVPALKALLNRNDRLVQESAQQALDGINNAPLWKLLQELEDRDPRVRTEAAENLSRMAACAPWIMAPALIKALKDESPAVRLRAANGLGSMDLEADRVVPPLIEALSDHDRDVRQYTAMALMRLGPTAKAAVPILRERVLGKEEIWTLRDMNAVVLAVVGAEDDSVATTLIEALKDSRTRGGAACGLHRFGRAAKTVIPALVEAYHAPVNGVPSYAPANIRSSILQSIERIGPDAKAAVPLLIAVVCDQTTKEELRAEAARALGAIGPAAREALPALEAATRERSEHTLSGYAAKAIKKIQEME